MNNEQKKQELLLEIELNRKYLVQLQLSLISTQSSEDPNEIVRGRFIARLIHNFSIKIEKLENEVNKLE